MTKLGVKNAVLLERDQLTSGTTWHSAGLVWRLRPSDVEVELLAATRVLARDVLEQETGLWAGWNENGGLFIANNKERLDEYKRLMTVSTSQSNQEFIEIHQFFFFTLLLHNCSKNVYQYPIQ